MKIAVLMTCYNRVATTIECLRRLFKQDISDGYSLDVWLVDDGSPDGTGDKVKSEYPQVNVIKSKGVVGYGVIRSRQWNHRKRSNRSRNNNARFSGRKKEACDNSTQYRATYRPKVIR